MPAAELEIGPGLVRALMSAQHPDLADLPLEPLAHGWDNVMMRLGEDLVVRLPRRRAAAGLIEHEQRWLPLLAPDLPLPVPAPVRIGLPGQGYPWHWSVVPFLPGRSAAEAVLDPAAAGLALADFLARLHRPAPEGAPRNPVRGIPLSGRAARYRDNRGPASEWVDLDVADAVAADAAAAEWRHPGLWVHGDLHPANLLAAGDRLSAVIDFGDLCSGDPATDLAVAWLVLPTSHHAEFWQHYADGAGYLVDSGLIRRARGWAVHVAVAMLAHSADNPLMQRIALDTLARVSQEWPKPELPDAVRP